MTKTTLNTIALIINSLVVLALAGAIAFIGYVGLEKGEIAECRKLQAYEKAYAQFYVTQWQHDMCLQHGIELVKLQSKVEN